MLSIHLSVVVIFDKTRSYSEASDRLLKDAGFQNQKAGTQVQYNMIDFNPGGKLVTSRQYAPWVAG